MKTMTKKLGAIILALAMCFSLTCVAFAAEGDYTITVENSIGDATYNAYKVFDAQVDGDAVSYSIEESSPWYDVVNAATDVFTLTNYGGTTWHVEVIDGVSDAAVIAVFENAYTEEFAATLTAAATGTGNGSQITLDVGEPGYYFVTTTTGSVVSITTAAPTATIVDKNQKPGEGGEGKDLSKTADSESVSVGDTIEYTIGSYVPTYDGSVQVTDYTITDTMGAGLTLNQSSIKVTISGTGLDYEDITDECDIQVTYDYDTEGNIIDTVLTITWVIADIVDDGLLYPADSVVTITYTDTVNEAADETDMTNNVGLTWHRADPDDPDGGTTDTPTVTEYTYGFDLKKTDSESNVLTGAEFTLAYEDGTEITFLYDEDSDTYEVWDGSAEGTTTNTIEVTDGEVNVWGLAAGTYTLTETVAPDGYNLLESPVTIVIAQTDSGWTVTVDDEVSTGTFTSTDTETDEHGVADMAEVVIINNAGSTLPGTGGIGTTIFYIIGGVLVAGAVVVLITRRRMNSAD